MSEDKKKIIILSMLLKITTKINLIQIKQTVLYFSGTVDVFNRSLQEIELTNTKLNVYTSLYTLVYIIDSY